MGSGGAAPERSVLLRPFHLDLLLVLQAQPERRFASKLAWARQTACRFQATPKEKYLRAIASLPAGLVAARRNRVAWSVELSEAGQALLSGQRPCKVFGRGLLAEELARRHPGP